MRFEGVQPEFTDDDNLALRAWNLLVDGMGAINWAGFELVAAKLGIEDLDDLIDRLIVIKTYRAPNERNPELPDDTGAGGLT